MLDKSKKSLIDLITKLQGMPAKAKVSLINKIKTAQLRRDFDNPDFQCGVVRSINLTYPDTMSEVHTAANREHLEAFAIQIGIETPKAKKSITRRR